MHLDGPRDVNNESSEESCQVKPLWCSRSRSANRVAEMMTRVGECRGTDALLDVCDCECI